MSQLEEVVETTLVDCNQRSSSQYLGGNRDESAIFTNEIGSGIKLEIGDEVSIHGVMVSGVGAGSDTIEFKGDYLPDYKMRPKTRTQQVTTIEKKAPLLPTDTDNIMGGYQYVVNTNASSTHKVKDNECNIILNFYKNNNGESTIFLPRRYGYNDAYVGNTQAERRLMVNNWITKDEYTKGRCDKWIKARNFCSADYQYYRDGYDNTAGGANNEYREGHFILKTDNQRFTQLKMQGAVFYNANILNSIDDTEYPNPSDELENEYPFDDATSLYDLDPAIYGINRTGYDTYREQVEIKVDKGFNTPTNIASQVTNILRKGGDLEQFKILDDTGHTQQVASTYETNTWKPQRSAGFGTFSKASWDFFQAWDPENNPPSIRDEVFEYQACYENLFVKREELFTLGRKCNNWGGLLLMNDVEHADTSTHYIQTDLEYNTENLENLSALFKAQEKYPELFDNENFWNYLSVGTNELSPSKNINNSRFLHINQFVDTAQRDILGNDDYEIHNAVNKESLSSIPFFFKYDKTFEDIDTGGEDIHRLSYGYATKHQIELWDDLKVAHQGHGGSRMTDEDGALKYYIRLHPELVGGLHESVFRQYHTGVLQPEANLGAVAHLCGWDYHFTAYSTCALLNWTGMLDKDFYGYKFWATESLGQADQFTKINASLTDIAPLITQTYNGANDPLFNYDTISSRFYFSRLHTSEIAGQPQEQAGGFWEDALATSTTAGKEVWKMNKVFLWDKYTPDISPYYNRVDSKLNACTVLYNNDIIPNAFGFLPAGKSGIMYTYNIQTESWTPFDAQGGVMIEDFGYDEKDFEDGLWGILGFTYNQFNNQTINRTTRINDENQNSLKYVTTNCEVISSDTSNMNSNSFGSVMYGNKVACNGVIDHTAFDMRVPKQTFVPDPPTYTLGNLLSLPAVVEDTESIRVSAINLPRKVLQPYYTIRSDLIDKAHYIGSRTGNSTLPVMAVLNKQYSSGDFIFLGNQTQTFKVTNPRTITSITSQVCDPDGSTARIDLGSAVIYSVNQFRKMKTNLIGDLLLQEKESKK